MRVEQVINIVRPFKSFGGVGLQSIVAFLREVVSRLSFFAPAYSPPPGSKSVVCCGVIECLQALLAEACGDRAYQRVRQCEVLPAPGSIEPDTEICWSAEQAI